MDTLALVRDQEFTRLAEQAVRQYCRQVHEITYIEHGADNLIIIANREFVFRFPRNSEASERLFFETALLQKLAGKMSAVTIPEVVEINHRPLFVVARYIEGVHLTGQQIQQLSSEEQTEIGTHIATYMAEFNKVVSGQEIRRLRHEAGIDVLQEAWDPYFERLFARQPLPNDRLRPIIDEYYKLWKEYVRTENRTVAIHDDLHPSNLLFLGPRLSGVLDFGDANMDSIEEEMRWLYLMGDTVLDAAIAHYKLLTGVEPQRDHIRVWAIMHELSSFVDRLSRQDTDTYPFRRAQEHLRQWLSNFPL